MIQNIKQIQHNILSRYTKHGRKLPRRKTVDPYAIHISEVMLQQTQVDRVVPYFHQRMKDFPDYQSLAKASKTDLLKHRSGLGFNSRALRLQDCAKTIIAKNWPKIAEKLTKGWLKVIDGDFQIQNSTFKIQNWKVDLTELRAELQKLPWIWPYTSATIMAFSRNLPVPVIDTNIRRVLIFLFKLPETITAKELEEFATKIIPTWKSRDRHNALMDQWALLLTARKTKIKPLSKQSKFEGSDRQVRWWVMKQLTKAASLSSFVKEGWCEAQEDLWKGTLGGRDLLTMKKVEEEFPHKNVKDIVKGLQKEWLIKVSKWVITIAE